MRWDKLFDDLESQLEQEMTAEELDLEAEEERLRLGRLSVRERLVALHESGGSGSDYRIAITLAGGIRLTAHPISFGRDWFCADVDGGLDGITIRTTQCIVPIAAVEGVTLSHEQVVASLAATSVAPGPSMLSSRLGLTFVLRDLCRRRRPIDLVLTSGQCHGTLDRIGRDHVDVAIHDRGDVRRQRAVREYRIVPLPSIQLVKL